MTVNEFISLYKDFERTDPDIIAAKLAEAALLETVSEWGNRVDYAVGLCTAALLYDSPVGLQTMQSGSKKNEGNKYRRELEARRKRQHDGHILGFIQI